MLQRMKDVRVHAPLVGRPVASALSLLHVAFPCCKLRLELRPGQASFLLWKASLVGAGIENTVNVALLFDTQQDGARMRRRKQIGLLVLLCLLT